MTGTLAMTPEKRSVERASRVAWSVLVAAFAVFLVVCAVASVGIQYFLFDSTVPITANLNIVRGTAGLTGNDLIETVVRQQRTLTNSSVITTDGQSQVTLTFTDPRLPSDVVAIATVNNSTALDLNMFARPRFDWSSRGYEISLGGFRGSLEVWIPSGLPRPMRFALQGAADGTQIFLNEGGRYQVQMNEQQVRVINIGGEAIIVAGPTGQAQAVGDGQRGLYYVREQQFLLLPGFTDLLNTQQFVQAAEVEATPAPDTMTLSNWSCYNGPYDEPAGEYSVVDLQGRPAVRFVRGQGAQSHGETGCVLTFGAAGQNVSSYNYLSVNAVFRIDYQSLSLCGFEGSECPLMLRIDYVPVGGGRGRTWVQGFFATVDSRYDVPLPTICTSCPRPHEQVNQGVLYTFQSDNLMSLFAPDAWPGSILNVRVYASGHEYDVSVIDVAVLAGETDPPPVPADTAAAG